MAQKLLVSKAAIDVGTATGVDNFIFSSDYNTLKYSTTGSLSVVYSGSTGETISYGTINHNLGYYPFYIAYTAEVNGTQFYLMPYGFADAGYWAYFNCYAGTGNLIFRVEVGNVWSQNTGGGTVPFYYKIFKIGN